MECPMCGQGTPDDAAECPHCTATLRFATSLPPVPTPGAGPLEPVDRIHALARDREATVRPRWRAYRDAAMAGAIAWILMNLIAGLPVSILPRRLLGMAVVGCLIGAPMGALVYRLGGGALRGALVSVAGFIVQASVFPSLYCGGWVNAITTLWVVMAVLPGSMVVYHIILAQD